MKRKRIKIPLYFGDLILIKSNNFKKVSKKYNFPDMSGHGGFAFKNHKKSGYTRYYIVLDDNGSDHHIIAHEALHVVNYIFNDRHMPLDIVNDEPQAYLLGWIVKQCYEFLDNK